MSASNASPEAPDRAVGTPNQSYTPPVAPEAAQGLQYPMHPGIPFFANPFMSPFMPQQPTESGSATPQQQPQPAVQPQFMFSPAQYQEMMTQYFQQMMMASQFGQNMPFPMPFAAPMPVRPSSQASQADSVNEMVTAMRINENGHHEIPTATVAPIQPQSSSESGSPEKCRSSPGPDDGSCSRESPSIDRSRTSSVKVSENASTADSPERAPSISEDEKTANLIRKQMTEIEKEISRRSQNKNIKKIDDRELADLIGETAALSQGEQFAFAANFSTQSALPYTAPAQEKETTPPKTLNQLRSSFNLPESGPTTGPSISAQSVQQVPFPTAFVPAPVAAPAAAQQPMSFPTQLVNPFGQTQAFVPNGTIPGIPDELASFLPQSHQPTAPAQVVEQPQSQQGGMGLAPPPPPSHPVHRKTSAPSTSGNAADWPEENKENGDEPVWVLRDSYMKRLKRDEAAAQQQQQDEFATIPEPDLNEEERETDRLIADDGVPTSMPKKKNSKEKDSETVPAASNSPGPSGENIALVHEPAVLIEGVLFRARYLGSTQMICETRSSKAARMHQAQEAVARVKAPDGEIQPSTEIDLFISTEKIMVLNTDLQRISETDVRQDILMDHALRTISYIADIGDLVVLMARRMSASDSDDQCSQIEGVKRQPKVVCHVFESDEASFIAQSIGQAFQVAYVEFLRANGIDDPSYLRQIDYQEVLNSQELMGDELEMFARKETQKDVVVPKKNGEALGIVVVESGWGSMLPTVVLAHMNPVGPAARSNLLNVGDQIININGISLVGLPLSAAQTNIKNVKSATAVRLTVVSTPPVVEVRIRRPDTKYQLGFSVQNGVICSLLRGGIAERGGIRVGHRIIEINGQSVVAVAHDRIVNMLATAIGEIHMKTMPTSMFRLLTGQEIPQYI